MFNECESLLYFKVHTKVHKVVIAELLSIVKDKDDRYAKPEDENVNKYEFSLTALKFSLNISFMSLKSNNSEHPIDIDPIIIPIKNDNTNIVYIRYLNTNIQCSI